ncbi:MAG: ATP-dependent endonuclease [Nodosilinea sp.]
MHVKRIEVKNFRLLESVDLSLEKKTTVIVGRNNSGKTSLTELFRRLLSDSKPKFQLEDFSLLVHENFWKSFNLKCSDRAENEIRECLPAIEVRLTVSYKDEVSEHKDFVSLSNFIVDLNPDCSEALIMIRYELKKGKINDFFEGVETNEDIPINQRRSIFFRAIKERIPKLYEVAVQAIDPNDISNYKTLEFSQLKSLLQSGFITAQRGLDDATHTDKGILCDILVELFNTAISEAANPKDREIAQALEKAVKGIQETLDGDFNENLKNFLPALELFGYPGLRDPNLCTETLLDVQRLLVNHTKVRYLGNGGINLPEAYNGLGPRNLIFILLKLLEFFKKCFDSSHSMPGIHLVFIEEPEAHLHPQMQEVFIRQLNEIANKFSQIYPRDSQWPVQFIVTTHSSHIANEAPFRAMRYFLTVAEQQPTGTYFKTRIKDLNQGLSDTPPDDQKFLHQYMTLTRCDLLFADKAILIEGTTERLLLPEMIGKLDCLPSGMNVSLHSDNSKLSSQYISVIEVGGAYAHRFFKLLEFLELKTLIITDLDTVKPAANGRACKVSEGTHTSNSCIKDWFSSSAIKPDELIKKPECEKIRGVCRLSYQVPEKDDEPCGRSFEDAFILANPSEFGLAGSSKEEKENDAWEKTKEIKKSEFALKYAIEKTEWTIPRYIAEGLTWLAEKPIEPTIDISSSAMSEFDAPNVPDT